MKREKIRPPWIRNKKERKRILLAIVAVCIIFSIGAWYIPHVIATQAPLHTDAFKAFIKRHGKIARIWFFFVLSHFVLLWMAKKFPAAREVLIPIARIARAWHVPAAIFAMGLVIVHAFLALTNGWEWKFSYVTGAASFLLLLFVAFTGIFRYHNLDRKKHLIFGLGFAIMFMLHSLFGD